MKYSGVIFSLSIALAILLVELLLPLSWDNWIYHTAGWDLAKFGKWPYVGTWYYNFPGMAYIHAVSILLFGPSDLSFRVFDLLFEMGVCCLLVLTTRRHLSGFASLITPIIYCLIYTSLGWSAAGQVDAFATGFLLAGLLLIRRAFDALLNSSSQRRRYLLFFGGALLAFCTILRPTYLLFPASVLLLVALDKPRRSALPALTLGCAAGIVIPLAPYFFFEGGAYEFYTQAFRFGLEVYSKWSRSPLDLWHWQHTTILFVGIYLCIALIAGIVHLRQWREKSSPRKLLFSFDVRVYVALIACCLISILVMRKYLVSHMLPLIALISPLIAAGTASPAQLIPRRSLGLAISLLLLVYFGYCLFPRNIVHHFIEGTHSPLGPLLYCYNLQDNDPWCGYLAERDAAEYMNKINPGKESVEVVSSFRSYLRVRCNLEGITKFTVIMPLVLRNPDGQFTSFQREWQQEYLKKLKDRKPRVIVEADNRYPAAGFTGGPLEEVEKIDGFKDFFEKTYRRDTAIHGFTFYLCRQ